MLSSWNAKLTKLVSRIHLLYLGLLPSLATFAVLRTYGYSTFFRIVMLAIRARRTVGAEWVQLGALAVGIAESTVVRVRLLDRGDLVREDDGSITYIALLVLAWVGSLMTGGTMHELASAI